MIFLAVLIAIIALAMAVKYPIFSLVIFMSTSLFKGYLVARVGLFQRIDFTVLATLYVLFGIVVSLIKHPQDFRKLSNWPFFMMIFLAGLLFFGLAYTSSPNYGLAKSSRYFVFGSVMFLAPLLFLRTVSDIKLLIWFFVISGLLIGVATIFNIQEGRASFLEADTIGTAVKIALGALISFCFIINKNSSLKSKIVSGIILFVCFLGIVLTGSRGPLLGLIVCCAIASFFFGRRISLYWLIPGLVIGILGFGYSMRKAEQMAGSSFFRIAAFWQQDRSVGEIFGDRILFYTYAVSNIPHAPMFGHGTGSFAMDFDGVDERGYPHNIFLELGYENGIVGVITFTVFLFMIYKKWKESRIYAHHLGNEELCNLSSIVGLVFIYFFLQVLKSGDIDGNRFLFFCSGFIMSTYYVITEQFKKVMLDSYDTNEFDK
jgi:hypothetical protein